MSPTTREVSVFKPVSELSQIFGKPALVGPEKLEDYENLFAAVASAIKPPDAIGWLYMKDFVDWSWEIRRERIVRAQTVKHYEKEVVGELLKSVFVSDSQLDAAYYRIFTAAADLELWASSPKCRKDMDRQLAEQGYDAEYVLARVYDRGGDDIAAIDKRIAAHEQRRSAALKEVGHWSDRLERRLRATSDVIDAEYTEEVE